MNEIEQSEQEVFACGIAEAQRTWPGIQINRDVFYRYLQECLLRIQSHQLGYSSIGQLQIKDLYLSFAILHGSPEAVVLFERQFLSSIERHMPQRLRQAEHIDEIKQEVRIKLLIHTMGKPSKLASYCGQSPLGGWLAAVVRRVAVDYIRKIQPPSQELADNVLARAPAALVDPERRLDKSQNQERLRQSIRQVLASLSTAERVLLDRHFRCQHSLAQIAREENVHRSTVMRQLHALLEHLRRLLSQALRQELQVSDTDFFSLLRVLMSQL